jgi:hypothetical protein
MIALSKLAFTPSKMCGRTWSGGGGVLMSSVPEADVLGDAEVEADGEAAMAEIEDGVAEAAILGEAGSVAEAEVEVLGNVEDEGRVDGIGLYKVVGQAEGVAEAEELSEAETGVTDGGRSILACCCTHVRSQCQRIEQSELPYQFSH